MNWSTVAARFWFEGETEHHDERDDEIVRCPECGARFPNWWIEEGHSTCPECGAEQNDSN